MEKQEYSYLFDWDPSCKPNLKEYPVKKGKHLHLSGIKNNILTSNWLEYSVVTDSVYCYYCREFCDNVSKGDAFTKTGHKNWKKAVQKLLK